MYRSIAILLTALAGAGAASAGTVSLIPSSSAPPLSSVFTIDVIVNGNAGEIVGFGLDYTIGSPAITLQNIAINPFFGADLGLPDTQVSAVTFPGSTDPTLSLVSFQFLVAQLGPISFSIHTDPLDPNEGLFYLDGSVGALDSEVSLNAVPEPSTFGLGALALGIMIAAARRRLR